MKLERLIPNISVTIRPSRQDDSNILAKWIQIGRKKGVFRPGREVTATSMLDFQASRGINYKCFIAEVLGEPIGYIDLSWRVKTGVLMGIYIMPSWRRQMIASYLMRYGCAYLQSQGCLKVRVEVFESNRPSRILCEGIGMLACSILCRKVNPEPVVIYELACRSYARLSPLDPSYASLQGTNLVIQHLAIAEALTNAVKELPGVEMVLGLGSLARGYGDEWSDIDIVILGRGPVVDSFWRGERWMGGFDIDLFVVDLDVVSPKSWDEARKQAYQESIVLYNRTPRTLREIKNALTLRPSECQSRIADLLLQMGWLGFAPRNWFMQERFGYFWSLPPDEWIRRGSIPSAHVTLDRVMDMQLQLLFLSNGRRIPDAKWRRFLVESLPWLPKAFSGKLKTIERAQRDEAGYRLRSENLLDLVEETIGMLESKGLVAGDIYKIFLRNFPDYNPRV